MTQDENECLYCGSSDHKDIDCICPNCGDHPHVCECTPFEHWWACDFDNCKYCKYLESADGIAEIGHIRMTLQEKEDACEMKGGKHCSEHNDGYYCKDCIKVLEGGP